MPHLELIIPVHHFHVQPPVLTVHTRPLLDVDEEGDEFVAHRDVEGELHALFAVHDGALHVPVDVGVVRFVVGLHAY